MFQYTRVAISSTVNDIKGIARFSTIAMNIIFIAYLIYAICTGGGILYVNIGILAAAVAYFVIDLVTYDKKDKASRLFRRTSRHAYKRIKIALKAISVVVVLYGVYISATHLTPMSVIMAAVTAIGWLVQLALEMVSTFAENRLELILTAIEADLDPVKRPIETVGNFIKKVSGKEVVEEEKRPSRFRKILDKKLTRAKEEIAREKEEKKRKKNEQKARADAERAAQRATADAARAEEKSAEESVK